MSCLKLLSCILEILVSILSPQNGFRKAILFIAVTCVYEFNVGIIKWGGGLPGHLGINRNEIAH